MPTYDYRCDACGHTFEEFQTMSAKPLRKCPKCAKLKLTRLIGTGAGFIFKGGGFWQTDYRSESYKAGEKAEAEAVSSASKTETKTETKSDSTTKSDAPAKKDGAAAKAESAPAAKSEPVKAAPVKAETKPGKSGKGSKKE